MDMGRMKELYMDIQDYYDGAVPEDLTIGEYLHKKRLVHEEWEAQNKIDAAQGKKDHDNNAELDVNGSSNEEKSL